ncbi:LRR receptor-like serine/threonine-protein kinase [Oopsacas minuta]|uniref:LRR receptor-like serine/threonine-protein kinase n=1 Tax=Oopsacas minuta TaxID=111878 RepID=A0AAV7K9P5_9METZ|nr:LRR receptor-like serine/threonine-protein kinase [Oopsacas minuta]
MTEIKESIRYLQDVNIITAPAYELGRGTFGVVYKAKWLGANVAVKYLHSHLFSQQPERVWKKIVRDFENEYKFLANLRHPNIVQYFGLTKQNEAIGIVTELAWGSLFKRNYMKPRLTLRHVVDCAIQLGAGLRYLHEQNPPIIHRDFASKNVLLGFDGQAKIADLGVATLVSPHVTHMTQSPGTEPYIAPECRIHKTYTEKIDIFSYAVTILELCTNQVPKPKNMFHCSEDPNTGIRSITQVPEVNRRENDLRIIGPTHCLYNIILEGIKDEPEARPSAHQMLTLLNKIKSISDYTNCPKEGILDGIQHHREKNLQQQIYTKEAEVMQMMYQLEQAKKDLQNMKNNFIAKDNSMPYRPIARPNLSSVDQKINQPDLTLQMGPNTPTDSMLQQRIQRPKDLPIQKNNLVIRGKKHNDMTALKDPYPKASPTRMDISKQLNQYELQRQQQIQQAQLQAKPQTPVLNLFNPQFNQLIPEHRIPVYYIPSRQLTNDTMDVNKMYIVPNAYDMIPRGQPQSIEVYPVTENTTANSSFTRSF